jgi:hypothetical protein
LRAPNLESTGKTRILRLYTSLLAAAALLALAAGCGSSNSTTSSSSSTSTTTSTNPTADGKTTTNKNSSGGKKSRKEQDPHACGKLGITPDTDKEGTCVQGKGANKRSVTLVNGGSTLKLQELNVKVMKVSTPSSVSGPAGTVKPVAGKTKSGKSIPKAFVVLEITWKNNDKQSQQLNSSGKQLALQSAAGGGQVFPPAEKVVPDSTFNAKAVEPGKKGKVEAIFQVPEKAAEAIQLRGAHPQLAVWEFSTAGQKKERPSGFIRLWNV